MSRNALLINLHCRGARRQPDLVRKLDAAFARRGPFVVSQNPTELPEALATIRKFDPEVLFICGGDGTLQQAMTHLVKTYGENPLPKIAILPAGTMNVVAQCVGIRSSPVKQLQRLLARHARSTSATAVRRRLLEVNEHFGFVCAIGGFSRLIEHYCDHASPTRLRGFALVARATLSAAANGGFAKKIFGHFTASVWADGKPVFENASVTNVAAASIRHIGFGFKPFLLADQPQGGFGMLVFKSRPRSLLFHLPRLRMGRPIADSNLLQLPARSAVVKLAAPMRPMLDGDLLAAADEIRFRSGPWIDFVVA